MVKDIKGWKITKSLGHQNKVSVKSFPGATISCMKDYIKPSLNSCPENIIIHAGTNDLHKQSPSNIASNIVDLAKYINTLDINDHQNIDPRIHLNRSNLHLNKNGNKVVAKNFTKMLHKC